MANFYALPSLTNFSQLGGWSSTSGGASNGVASPSTGDNVIFDVNSGTARTITLGSTFNINSLVCTGAPMSLSGGGGLAFYGSSVDLSGFSSISLPVALNASGTTTIKSGSCPLLSLTVSAPGGVLMSGDLFVSGAIIFADGGFNLNGYNLTCTNITDANASGGCTLSLGSGIITLTSTLSSNYVLQMSYATISPGTATVKLTNACYVNNGFMTTGNSLWISNSGSGSPVMFTSSTSLAKIRIDPGSNFGYANANMTWTAAVWQVTGAPNNLLNIRSFGPSSGYRVYFNNSTPSSKAFLDFCNLSGVVTDATFIARSSVDDGYNSGVTFFKLKPHFLTFF